MSTKFVWKMITIIICVSQFHYIILYLFVLSCWCSSLIDRFYRNKDIILPNGAFLWNFPILRYWLLRKYIELNRRVKGENRRKANNNGHGKNDLHNENEVQCSLKAWEDARYYNILLHEQCSLNRNGPSNGQTQIFSFSQLNINNKYLVLWTGFLIFQETTCLQRSNRESTHR